MFFQFKGDNLPNTDHLSSFAILDWVALGFYFLISVVGGILSNSKQTTTKEYYRADGKIPAWAAAISLMATAQSAATFVSAPQSSFAGNLSYFSANFAHILGVCIVGFVFVPALYRSGANTVYGYLQHRFDGLSGLTGSSAFLLGRVFASGSRIFIGALAISYLCLGEQNMTGIQVSIFVLMLGGLLYTYMGGVKAVIWTDVLQAIIYVCVLLIAFYVLWSRIGLSPEKIFEILSAGDKDGKSKMILLQPSLEDNWTMGYTFFAVLIGHTLLAMGAYGTDFDLVQRFMTCKNAKEGSKSSIYGILMGVPIQFLFLMIGLLLFIIYRKTELIPNGNAIVPLPASAEKEVFIHFILYEMPAGLKGLMVAGLIAMTLSSINSGLNAMSSSFVNDIVKWKYKHFNDQKLLKTGKYSMIVFCVLLGGFASYSAYKMIDSKTNLIDYALGVMTYAYSGLLAVFCAGIFTKRGNWVSVVIAIFFGFLFISFLNDMPKRFYVHFNIEFLNAAAFPWKMTFATLFSFLICVIPKGKGKPIEVQIEDQKNVA